MTATARLPSLAVGNGRLLVTLDSSSTVLSACWPCVDSPNQFAEFSVRPVDKHAEHDRTARQTADFGYLPRTNIAFGETDDGLAVQDLVYDFNDVNGRCDVLVRRVTGTHADLSLYLVPELDGRPGAQTIYWDEQSEALLAFCRDKWVAVGCHVGRVYEYHCGRHDDESSGRRVWHKSRLTGERVAFRHVDGLFRIRGSAEAITIFSVFGHTREVVLNGLHAIRSTSWDVIQQGTRQRGTSALTELSLAGWSPDVDRLLERSCLVLNLLTDRKTGGTIAGPDVQSGIQSAPGYAAVWGRDAAWTLLGALAMGCKTQAEAMLQFAVRTQAPEGLWIHRHHTDYTTASSWGLHQIDETGILLHSMSCYVQTTGSPNFAQENWNSIRKAAEFLVSTVDGATGLPYKSVDLWEEREGIHLYTVASVIAGLRAASSLAQVTAHAQLPALSDWSRVADDILAAALRHFWNDELGRFVTSTQCSSALPMVDTERPELSAVVQEGESNPETAIPQYPNWRDRRVVDVNYGHDVSVLSLAVPFGILPLDDARVVSTAEKLRQTLYNHDIGGLARYEGDTYGGGNPWPLATLWLAIYEGARGEQQKAKDLVAWTVDHTTRAGLVPEQVHRVTGQPVAAVPLSWSHGMVALAVSACVGQNVWMPNPHVKSKA